MTLDWIEQLRSLLSSVAISTNPTVLEHHSHDESYHSPRLPQAVVFPTSVGDVVAVVNFAREHRIPIVPFGAGSSLEGHVVPVRGGISLDMTRMNRVVEVRPDDLLVCVECGVTRSQLNAELARHGLFFPVDPGADATLGGMAATNASGTTTVRYGAMRDNVRRLQVVLANGHVIEAGSITAKSSSGYNIAPLFVGSEGTLGVITKVWLRVYGRPETTVAASAEFSSIADAILAAQTLAMLGIRVSRLEFVEAPYLEAVNRFRGTAYPLCPTLFLEFQGSADHVAADIASTEAIMTDAGCTRFQFVRAEEDRNQLWQARHQALRAFMSQYPGHVHMATDVCVPLSELAGSIRHARSLLDTMHVKGAIIGHVGDGNFHVSMAFHPDDHDEQALVSAFHEKVVDQALSVGGTCTGEHGVGLGKMKYQAHEHGDALAVMQSIKAALDPLGIMNPGKLIDL